jgi:hypothetical protein
LIHDTAGVPAESFGQFGVALLERPRTEGQLDS